MCVPECVNVWSCGSHYHSSLSTTYASGGQGCQLQTPQQGINRSLSLLWRDVQSFVETLRSKLRSKQTEREREEPVRRPHIHTYTSLVLPCRKDPRGLYASWASKTRYESPADSQTGDAQLFMCVWVCLCMPVYVYASVWVWAAQCRFVADADSQRDAGNWHKSWRERERVRDNAIMWPPWERHGKP